MTDYWFDIKNDNVRTPLHMMVLDRDFLKTPQEFFDDIPIAAWNVKDGYGNTPISYLISHDLIYAVPKHVREKWPAEYLIRSDETGAKLIWKIAIAGQMHLISKKILKEMPEKIWLEQQFVGDTMLHQTAVKNQLYFVPEKIWHLMTVDDFEKRDISYRTWFDMAILHNNIGTIPAIFWQRLLADNRNNAFYQTVKKGVNIYLEQDFYDLNKYKCMVRESMRHFKKQQPKLENWLCFYSLLPDQYQKDEQIKKIHDDYVSEYIVQRKRKKKRLSLKQG